MVNSPQPAEQHELKSELFCSSAPPDALWVIKLVFARLSELYIVNLPYLQRAGETRRSVCVSKPLLCFRANKRCRLQLLGYRRCRGEMRPRLDAQDHHSNRKEAACRAELPPSVNRHADLLQTCLLLLLLIFIEFSRESQQSLQGTKLITVKRILKLAPRANRLP